MKSKKLRLFIAGCAVFLSGGLAMGSLIPQFSTAGIINSIANLTLGDSIGYSSDTITNSQDLTAEELASVYGFVDSTWYKPVPANPSEIIADGSTTGYLYNEKAGGFLAGGNEWKTRASISPTGDLIRFGISEETGLYTIGCYPSSKNAWRYVACNDWDGMWVDATLNNSSYSGIQEWNLEQQSNGSYKIWNESFGDRNYPLGVAEYFDGLEGNTRLYIYNPDEEVFSGNFYDEWYFIPEDEYEYFVNEIARYNAAIALQAAINAAHAQYPNLDYSYPLEVYNNTSAAVEELEDAAIYIDEIVRNAQSGEASEDNPLDVTDWLQNADFSSGSIDGWDLTISDYTNRGYQRASYNGEDASLNGFIEFWRNSIALGDGAISQTIYGMPEGKYKLTVDVIATDQYSEDETTGVQLFATGGSIDIYQPVATGNGVPQHFELTFFNDASEVTLGLRTSGTNANWIAADNFTLTYYGETKEDPYKVLLNDAIAKAISTYPLEDLEGLVASAAAKEEFQTVIEEAQTAEDGYEDYIDLIGDVTKSLTASVEAYNAYTDEIEYILNYIITAKKFEGEEAGYISDYVDSDEAPNALYPNGAANYIIGNGNLSDEEIAAETTWAELQLRKAIVANVEVGDDLTFLVKNASFKDGFTGWTKKNGNIGGLATYPNVEVYENVVDIYQIVEGVPDGIYSLSCKAFERPSFNGNYDGSEPAKVFLYMNDLQTPVQNIMASAMPEDEAINEENCYFGSGSGSWPYDYLTDKGWVPNSMDGASYAFQAGRYEQKVYGLVQGGTMKIGLTSKGETAHWVLWADFQLTYEGGSGDAINIVLNETLAPFEEYVDQNADKMNALALNAALAVIENVYDAIENGDEDTKQAALLSISPAQEAAAANVAAMTSFRAAYPNIANVKEEAINTASEDVQAAYEKVIGLVDDIDNLTTDEIVELAELIRTSLRGLDYIVIETAQAGELGNLVLDFVENFSDVKKIKVVGPINSADMENIGRMTNAVEIDLGEATGLKQLEENTFRDNDVIQRIVLPNSLTSISNYAFYSCDSLRYVYLPGSLGDNTGYRTFNDCQNLETVEMGEGITTIVSYMFANCYRLKTVQLPSTLKAIDYNAFYNCYQLTDFTLPEGLTTIAYNAFYHESADASVYTGYYYDENGRYQERYLEHVTPTELTIPASVTSIGYQAFYNWRDLKNVTLNEGLTVLREHAFLGTQITEVTLPSSLSSIGYDVFSTNPITVTCNALVPPTETNTSSAPVVNPGTLYVPNIAVKAYKQAPGWDKFNIVGYDYIPNDIAIDHEVTLEVKDSIFANAKPNVWLNLKFSNSETGYTESGYTEYGALTTKGDQTLSMGIFNIIADPNYGYDLSPYNYRNYRIYATLVNNTTMRADSVNTRIYIHSNRWNFLSFPYNVKVSDIKDTFGNAQWVIRKYDGQKRADAQMDSTWVNMNEDDVLEAHQGYIWQLGERSGDSGWYGTFDVPAINDAQKNNIFASDDVEIVLDEYQSEFAHNRSWNLIGNPYPSYYDTRAMNFEAPITVWNYYYSRYEAYSPVDDSFILAPNEAFFVQRPVDQESIVFAKEGRQHTQTADAEASYESRAKARRAAANVQRSVFNLTLSDGENADRTRVVINAQAQMGYEVNKDASKFFSASSNAPQFFSVNDDVRYAINERPLNNGSVVLGMTLNAAGTYTIHLDTKAAATVVLEDTETGETINLTEADYSFNAQAGTSEARFILHVIDDEATGINAIATLSADGSELYTLDGRRVNGIAAAGIYLVKKGQKFQKVYVK